MLRLFGIPVRFDAGWLLVFALCAWALASGYFPSVLPGLGAVRAWLYGTGAASLLFGSIIVHELAHALVARAHGVGVGAIRLHVFGGVAELDDEPPSPRVEIAIASVGPLVSFVIAAAAFAALRAVPGGTPAAFLGYVGGVNVLVGLFNLLPAFPLDGGRLLRAALWWWLDGVDRATRMAARVGSVIALGLVAIGGARLFGGDAAGGLWLALIGIFIYQAAQTSGEVARVRSRLQRMRVADVMTAVDGPRSPSVADTVRSGDSAWLAFLRLARTRAEQLMVVEDGAVVGVLDRARLRDAFTADRAADDVRRAA